MTPWTVAHQAPLCLRLPSQEYWSGLPFSSPGDIPDPGIKPESPTLQADSLQSEPLEAQVTVRCPFLISHCTLYIQRAEKISLVFSKQLAWEINVNSSGGLGKMEKFYGR